MFVHMEDAAESVSSADVELIESAWFGERIGGRPQWCAVQAAVGSVLVVEGFELAECVLQVGLVPDQGAVKKLVPAGLHPPFSDRVHAGNADAGKDDLDAFGLQDGVERAGVFAITIPDQVFERDTGVLQVHDEVSGHLGGPVRVGMGGGAQDTDPSARVLDDNEDVVSGAGECGRGEEVARQDRVRLTAEEAGPGLAVPLGSGFDPVLLKNLPYRGGGDCDAGRDELTVNAAVAPVGVLSRQAQDEGLDGAAGRRTGRGVFGGSGRRDGGG